MVLHVSVHAFYSEKDVIYRCTFAYGDSSTNPDTLCTSDIFAAVLANIFIDVKVIAEC